MKRALKIIILVILVVLLIVIGRQIYIKYNKNKLAGLLEGSNSTNYVLVEKQAGEESTTVKVMGKNLLSDNSTTCIWISEEEKSRIIIDKSSNVAIKTENAEDLKVNSLNYTFLNNYFNNSSQNFKYKGKEDNFLVAEFTNKANNVISKLYINKDTGIVEKLVENFGDMENVTEYEVTLDAVSQEDVAEPDLSGYDVGYSSSTSPTETEIETETETQQNLE